MTKRTTEADSIKGFTEKLVNIANQQMQQMEGMSEGAAFEFVKNVIDGAAIVFGVYQDATAADGVGLKIIKGEREMQAVVASGDPEKFVISAIPCISLEQAVATAAELGDGKRKTN